MIIPKLYNDKSFSGLNFQNPNITALASSDGKISWLELHNLSDSLAATYSSQGVKSGNRVALLFTHSAEFVISVFSLWKIGAVPVALNIRLTEYELLNQLSFLKTSHLILDDLNQERLNSFSGTRILTKNGKKKRISLKKPGYTFSLKNLALILFTSGSTGTPKAVPFTFNNLLQNSLSLDKLIGLSEKDIWLASLPFYHIGGFAIITRALFSGSTIAFPNSFSLKDITDAVNYYDPSLLSLVPTSMLRLIRNKFSANKYHRFIFLGGSPVSSELILDAASLGWNPVKVYGSTETTSMVTALFIDDVEENGDSAGKPLSGVSLEIIENEIVLSGKSIVTEYVGNISDTGTSFKNKKYYTGDLGFVNKTGFLYVTGRRSQFIISGGENINISQVESVINTFEKVENSVVVGVKDSEWGEIPVAFVSPNIVSEKDRLIEHLKQKLAGYKIPKRFIFLDELPMSELGKVEMDKLKQLLN